MPSSRRTPEYCAECFRRLRGYARLRCPECGTVRSSAGYAGRIARLRAEMAAKPKKRSRYTFSSIL